MKLARVFFDCDLRAGFEGLQKMMKENQIADAEMVLFMNRRLNSFKLLKDNTYLVYYKNGNRRIPLESIQHLPLAFGGPEFDFSKAIDKSIREKLKVL